MEDYYRLAFRNEELKTEERMLTSVLENTDHIKSLLLEKEKKFCLEDQSIRASSCGRLSVKDSIRKRCFNLIDHLVHYKCINECLANDVLNMKTNIIDDDEYVRLTLTYRDVEHAIAQAIRLNQQRNNAFLDMHDEEAQSYLAGLESDWRMEHEQRRKLLSKIVLDQKQFFIDKTTKNLEQQQKLLNERYQSISNLIKLSYNNHLMVDSDHNNNNNNCNSIENKNRA